MPQPKDYDPDSTDPTWKQHWRGNRSAMANAEANVGRESNGAGFKWFAAIAGVVIGGIVIAQLQFFGSAVIDQGKSLVRLDERMAAVQDAVKRQGDNYDEFRREVYERIRSLEQRGQGGGGNGYRERP